MEPQKVCDRSCTEDRYHDALGLRYLYFRPRRGQSVQVLWCLRVGEEEKGCRWSAQLKSFSAAGMSIIWSSPLSDHNRVTASNQFALPVLGYLMWTQQWPMTELKTLDREARKKVVENGGKHPSGSTAVLYMPREKGGRGLRSIEVEYKVTKIKAALKLYRNGDSAMAMACDFEERAEEFGHSSLVKEAVRYAEEMGLQLQLE